MKKLLPILFIIILSCKAQEKTIYETKMFHEVYLFADYNDYWKIKRRFEKRGLPMPYIEEIVHDNRYIISIPFYCLNERAWYGYLIPYRTRETAKNEY